MSRVGLIFSYGTTSTGTGLSYKGCFASSSTGYGCNLITNGYVDEPSDLVVTPDGKELLLANGDNTGTDYSSGSVVGFARSTAAATLGNLSAPTTATCIQGDTTISGCQTRNGAFFMRGLSVFSNSQIYAAGYYGIFRIDRNASTNALSIAPDAAACASVEASGFPCGTLNPNSGRIYTHRDVIVSKDGRNLYSENENGSAATIHSLSRASNGTFKALPSPLKCLSVDGGSGCDRTLSGGVGNTTNNLVISPDGRNVYAAGGNRLFSFARDRAPVCRNVSASTVNTSAVRVTFNCSDPDGDPLSYQKVTDPGRGTLAGVSGNGVSYGPQPGTTGTDAFQYRAIGGGVASDPATAFVNVSAPPPPPPPRRWHTDHRRPLDREHQLAGLPEVHEDREPRGEERPGRHDRRGDLQDQEEEAAEEGLPVQDASASRPPARASKLTLSKPFKKRKVPVGAKIAHHDHRSGLPRQAHHVHDPQAEGAKVEGPVPQRQRPSRELRLT